MIAGPDPIGPSIVCGVLSRDRDLEEQGRFRGGVQNVVFTAGKDPSTVITACCDRYQRCLIWRAEKERIAEGRATLETSREDED
jgi:hypothetical protein